MPTVMLTLDPALYAQLEALSDFEGEDIEETIRIGIRSHYRHLQMMRAEFEEEERAAKTRPRVPAIDDEIPL